MHRLQATIFVVGMNLLWLSGVSPVARAQDEAGPKLDANTEKVVKAAAQYLKGLDGFSVTVSAWTSFQEEAISQYNKKIFTLAMQRPNQLALVLKEGLAGPSVVLNGKKSYIYRPMLAQYLIDEAPGDFESLFVQGSEYRETLRGTIPLIDALLSKEPYRVLMEGVVQGVYSGTGEIEGVKCHRLRFVQEELDWELWVEMGDKPLLRRIIPDLPKMLSKLREVRPELAAVQMEQAWHFDDWQTNTELPPNVFAIRPPAEAQEVLYFENPQQSPQPRLVGKAAPDFTLELVDGGEFQLAQHKGNNVVVLEFWATWCGPCRQALPVVARVAEKYKDQGVVFYAINQGESSFNIKDFLKRSGLKMTVALDPYAKVANQYAVVGIPQTVVIDKNGIVQGVHVGVSADGGRKLQREIAALLAGKTLLRQWPSGTRDLSCTEVTFLPPAAKVGDEITFAGILKNSGTATVAAGTYKVGLIVKGQRVFFGPGAQDIGPDEQTTFSVDSHIWHLTVTEPGSYDYTIMVDPDNSVPETNEQDNALNGVFEVTQTGKPDVPMATRDGSATR